MKNLLSKLLLITKNPILILIIMLDDLSKVGIGIYEKLTLKTPVVMDINYYDFIIRLLMAIAIFIVFRQYYKMRDQQKLNKLFNKVMVEKTYNLDELMTDKRNSIVRIVRQRFIIEVYKVYEDKMTKKKIDKMANDYLEYLDYTETNNIL